MNQSYNRGRDRGGRGSSGKSSQFQSQFPHFNQFQFQQAQSNSNGIRSERPICQICGKVGHLALDCYHRMDYAYQGKHPPTKLAAIAFASNLASVHKICHDNKCWCYFDENTISIQALAAGKILYQGKSEDGVYPIYPQKASQLSLSSKVCNSVASVSVFNKTLWHMRLDHPSDQVLKHLFPNANVSFN